MSRAISYLERFLLDRDPLILASPINGALVDLAGGNPASLLGGATIGDDVLAPGQRGSLSLDGSDDYASVAAPASTFANGTVRTYVGLARLSADAAAGVAQTLIGSDLAANGTRLDLYNSAGTRQARLQLGGTTYAWNLTAVEIAATAAGQTFAYRLEFNEPADTADLQINGLPAVTKTSVTAQHGAGQTAVQLGAYSSGISPFPGKLGLQALIPRPFTTTETRMWQTIVEYGGPFRLRRRR